MAHRYDYTEEVWKCVNTNYLVITRNHPKARCSVLCMPPTVSPQTRIAGFDIHLDIKTSDRKIVGSVEVCDLHMELPSSL